MIEEAFVSFEVAKLLKEKGFITPCNWLYCKDGSFGHRNSVWDTEMFPAPTQQMACRWLREKKLLEVNVSMQNGGCYSWEINDISCPFDGGIDTLYYSGCTLAKPTYEEAVDAAIKYCLEHLI